MSEITSRAQQPKGRYFFILSKACCLQAKTLKAEFDLHILCFDEAFILTTQTAKTPAPVQTQPYMFTLLEAYAHIQIRLLPFSSNAKQRAARRRAERPG